MNAGKKVLKNKHLRRWMILQSISIVIVSVMTFLLVEYFINVILNHDPDYNPIDGLGMIGPMGAVMYFFLITL